MGSTLILMNRPMVGGRQRQRGQREAWHQHPRPSATGPAAARGRRTICLPLVGTQPTARWRRSLVCQSPAINIHQPSTSHSGRPATQRRLLRGPSLSPSLLSESLSSFLAPCLKWCLSPSVHLTVRSNPFPCPLLSRLTSNLVAG